MRITPVRRGVVATAATASLFVFAPSGVAHADAPIGTCTNSYQPYTEDALVAIDPGAAAVFPIVDTNGDGIVCFKPYPNGDHNGHGGNLVDDKAGPHQ